MVGTFLLSHRINPQSLDFLENLNIFFRTISRYIRFILNKFEFSTPIKLFNFIAFCSTIIIQNIVWALKGNVLMKEIDLFTWKK